MGFNIKTSFGTLVDNHDGGIVIASTDDALKIKERIEAVMGNVNIEDADFEDITEEDANKIKAAVTGKNAAPASNNPQKELPQIIIDAPAKTFTQNSYFIKKMFANAVMKYYLGKPTNLAYIAVVCDDWGLLRSRSNTLDIVRSCFAVGAIPYIDEADVKRINDTVKRQLNGQYRYVNGIKCRDEGLASDYKSWGDEKKDLIEFCDKIAKEFEGPGMYNRFEKNREDEMKNQAGIR